MRGNRKLRRELGLGAKLFFYGMLGAFVLLAALAALAGWWIYSVVGILLGVTFAATAPFVLGRGWRPADPRPTRRPVIRRRR